MATRCVSYSPTVEVTIMDLPQQLEMMRQQTKELPEAARIHGHGANLLDPAVPFPTGFDAIWMCQVPRLLLGRGGNQHSDPCGTFYEQRGPSLYHGNLLEPSEVRYSRLLSDSNQSLFYGYGQWKQQDVSFG